GINTETPHASSDLELASPDKALLLNRVANTAAVADPTNGMLIYDLEDKCVKAYQGDPLAWSDCLDGSGGNNNPDPTLTTISIGYTNGGFNFASGHPNFRAQLENPANYGSSGVCEMGINFEFTNANPDLITEGFTAADLKAKYHIIVTG